MNDFVYSTAAEDIAALINLISHLIDNRGNPDATSVYLHTIPFVRKGNDYTLAETISALESKYALNQSAPEMF